MVHEVRALGRILGDGVFDVNLRQHVVALCKEDPRVGIQISRIVRLQLDAPRYHPLRLLEVFFLQRQEVAIVVEDDDIVRVVLERLVVGFVGLRQILDLIVDVADLPVEIRAQVQVLLRDDLQSRAVGRQRVVVLLLLEVADAEVEIELRRIGEQLRAPLADAHHLADILLADSHLQQRLPRPVVRRFDFRRQLELETRLFLLVLRQEEATEHQLQIDILRMLVDERLEQRVRAFQPLPALLQAEDVAREDAHLRLDVQPLAHQRVAYLLLGSGLVARRFVIVGHADDVARVGGVNLVRPLVCLQRLVVFFLLEVEVAYQQLVARLAGILRRQLLDFGKGFIFLVQRSIELELLHREGLVHAHDILQRVVGFDGLAQLTLLRARLAEVVVKLRLFRIFPG